MQEISVKKDWIDDLPNQFQHKGKIEVLISAFAKQMQELITVFSEVDKLTDLETSFGKNLDYLGDIASVSRKSAYEILKKEKDFVVSDEEYKKIIKYKVLKNNSECTYEDIMKSIFLLWDTNNITYTEPEDRPATILITMPEVDVDGIDPSLGRTLSIKPSGVALLYKLWYHIELSISGKERFNLTNMQAGTKVPYSFEDEVSIYIKGISGQIREMASAEVSIQKNYWILNGEHLLDGLKLLNAEEHKEVL